MIGDGRAGRPQRLAMPMTALFDTPSRHPIAAVE
jgi:hypothetical protein